MELPGFLDERQRNLIEKHLDLVLEANEKVNLTRIESREQAAVLHIEDSLAALPELNNAPDGLYGDLGTGGGYPGIPLAIASGRKTVLIDARKKKIEMLDEIIESLGLSNQISTYAGRAELLARKESSKFSVLTARALSQLSVLMELASPLLKNGGVLICYKAVLSEEEKKTAEKIQKLVGMELVSERNFFLSDGETHRSIIVAKKSGKPSIKLPRLEGQAQKNPLH